LTHGEQILNTLGYFIVTMINTDKVLAYQQSLQSLQCPSWPCKSDTSHSSAAAIKWDALLEIVTLFWNVQTGYTKMLFNPKQ
jgi:hypothetical protein